MLWISFTFSTWKWVYGSSVKIILMGWEQINATYIPLWRFQGQYELRSWIETVDCPTYSSYAPALCPPHSRYLKDWGLCPACVQSYFNLSHMWKIKPQDHVIECQNFQRLEGFWKGQNSSYVNIQETVQKSAVFCHAATWLSVGYCAKDLGLIWCL